MHKRDEEDGIRSHWIKNEELFWMGVGAGARVYDTNKTMDDYEREEGDALGSMDILIMGPHMGKYLKLGEVLAIMLAKRAK
jgi:hypothetical protein